MYPSASFQRKAPRGASCGREARKERSLCIEGKGVYCYRGGKATQALPPPPMILGQFTRFRISLAHQAAKSLRTHVFEFICFLDDGIKISKRSDCGDLFDVSHSVSDVYLNLALLVCVVHSIHHHSTSSRNHCNHFL